jgi:hypothetical protein
MAGAVETAYRWHEFQASPPTFVSGMAGGLVALEDSAAAGTEAFSF